MSMYPEGFCTAGESSPSRAQDVTRRPCELHDGLVYADLSLLGCPGWDALLRSPSSLEAVSYVSPQAPACALGSDTGPLVLQAQIAQPPSPTVLSSPPCPVPGTDYRVCHRKTAAAPEEMD